MKEFKRILPIEKLKVFCEKWKIKRFYIFGSVLTERFNQDSDLDILVEFFDDAAWSLLDHVEMKDELVFITGRSVDLLTKKSVERSKNIARKNEIMQTAEVVYESAA